MSSSSAAAAADQPQDPRHLAMQQRFLQQQEARLQARLASKAQGEAMRDPKESVGLFWTDLRRTHEEVTSALDALVLDAPASAAEALARLGSRIDGLDQRITDAALFLPPYDVRRAQEEAGGLRNKLEAARAALAPRKKFAFSARRRQQQQQDASNGAAQEDAAAVPGPAAASLAAPTAALAGVSLSERQRPSGSVPAAAAAGAAAAAATTTRREEQLEEEEEMAGFAGRSDASLDLTAAMGPDPPKDLLLRDLERCTVQLLAPLCFLRLENLRDCRVVCGPVAGPVYLEGCRGCIIYLASRQLRIHNTESCDLYVHTVSGPIIEDCNGLRFAPFLLTYPALDEHMETAGLAGTKSAWSEVKDFKWLRAQQSPHWAVLPEAERKPAEATQAEKETTAGNREEEDEDEDEI